MPKKPFQLVPNTLSRDTMEALGELCRQAKDGELIGMAYVALYRGRVYTVDAAGEAFRNPTFTRGILRALDDMLGQMVGSKRSGDG